MTKTAWFGAGVIAGLMMLLGASAIAQSQEPQVYKIFKVKWVMFDDDTGERHYYWLRGHQPFDVTIPDLWQMEEVK